MKKILSFLVCAVITFSLLGIVDSEKVKAADFTDDAIVFDVEYTQMLDGEKYSSDDYRLIIPTAGTLIVEGYIDEYSPDYASNSHSCVNVYDEDKLNVIGYEVFRNDTSKKKMHKWTIRLDEGEYVIKISNSGESGLGDYWCLNVRYHYTFSFNFDSSADAKLSSPSKGSVKVTAPKGDKVNGFEVRYKKSGDKKWTTKTIETKKTLNEVIDGLASGKKYTFQVRKFVNDTYGYTYYSNWTKQQKVKVK